MSLSLHEQRVLREIDTRLWLDDPVFARQFIDHLRGDHRPGGDAEQQDPPAGRRWRQRGVLGALVAFVSVTSVVTVLLVLGPGPNRGCPAAATGASVAAVQDRTTGASSIGCPVPHVPDGEPVAG